MVRETKSEDFENGAICGWTNPSVRLIANGEDPIKVVSDRARDIVLRAAEQGYSGPPFDPFELAKLAAISVRPSTDAKDARTVSRGGQIVIEYNPSTPPARQRFSLCHELVHTWFPDCLERVRNREHHSNNPGDGWQLEMLCNIGASELLMPIGILIDRPIDDIHDVIALRREFKVSIETALRRAITVSNSACAMFVASFENSERRRTPFLEYLIPSKKWTVWGRSGSRLRSNAVVSASLSRGFVSSAVEEWGGSLGRVTVQGVGLSPLPGSCQPRVAGLIKPVNAQFDTSTQIMYVTGDATDPRGPGDKLLLQVVNDATPRWGAGFARAVRGKWPYVQQDFIRWAQSSPDSLRLGKVHFTRVNDQLSIAHLVCQHGYGPSSKPRLRYSALKTCLVTVADHLKLAPASLHLPRIGSGEAGGSWAIVSELISDAFSSTDMPIIVYDLPDKRPKVDIQRRLF